MCGKVAAVLVGFEVFLGAFGEGCNLHTHHWANKIDTKTPLMAGVGAVSARFHFSSP
jgi:hypothetical protein